MTTTRQIDHTAWQAEPSAEELARLRGAMEDGEFGRPSRERYGKKQPFGVMVAAMVGGFLGLIFAIMTIVALVRGDSDDVVVGLWFTGGVVAIGIACGWAASRSDDRHWKEIWRLVTFAKANGLEVQPEAKVVLLPGSIFTTRSHATTSERVTWSVDGRHVEVARHRRAGGGSVANSFDARYLAVRLDEVPRLSFTAARGPARPATVLGTEVVLTGTAGGRRRGTLVSRAASADAARAFMTDELVDLLTDPDHPCNAEAAGGWFFAYFPPRRKVDADTWRHTFALADAVVRAAGRRPVAGEP